MEVNDKAIKSSRPLSLVTGAAGFIGSHLVDRLLRAGHSVTGVDNLCSGSLENLQGALAAGENFQFVQADISGEFEPPALRYHFIWHLASPASPVDYGRMGIETMLVNSSGTKNMLDLAVKNSAKFLLASTSEVYGNPLVHPQTETYWGHVNPVGRRACYNEGKRFAEALAFEYNRRYNLDLRIVRIFNTFGPRMQVEDGRVVPNFICQALRGEPLTLYGDGTQTRSFVFVADEIEGIVSAMLGTGTTGEIINIGNPVECTIRELAEIVAALLGIELKTENRPLPADDPVRRCPDISKARAVLGWEPSTTLIDGMTETIDYFKGILAQK
jgi:nucleoside-diphosphate-sugar epimerase